MKRRWSIETPGVPAEHPIGLVRPPQGAGLLLAVELRLPAPHVGSDLRLGEHVLAAAPGSFRVLDLADVGDQHDQAIDAAARIPVRQISHVHVARRAELIEGAVVEHDRLAGQGPRDPMPNLLPGRLSQHLPHMAATNLLRCQSEPAAVRFVDPDITRVGVDEGQQRRHRVGHELELPLALPERVGLHRRRGHVMQDVDDAAVGQSAPRSFNRAKRAVRSEQPRSARKHISARRLWRRRPIDIGRLAMDEAHQRSPQAGPPAGARATRPPRRSPRRRGQRGQSPRPRPAAPRRGRSSSVRKMQAPARRRVLPRWAFGDKTTTGQVPPIP